jgi:hypothetical protein
MAFDRWLWKIRDIIVSDRAFNLHIVTKATKAAAEDNGCLGERPFMVLFDSVNASFDLWCSHILYSLNKRLWKFIKKCRMIAPISTYLLRVSLAIIQIYLYL